VSSLAAPPLRSGRSGDTPATGAVLGAYGPNAGVRPVDGPGRPPRRRTAPRRRPPTRTPASTDRLRGRTPLQARRHRRTRVGHEEELWHHQQWRRTAGSGAAGRPSERKSRATDPGRGAAVTVLDGNQRVARVRQSGCGSGVEVTERDHDAHRERGEGVINPAARSQHDTGSNLHRRCRTAGVSSPRSSIYIPSHTSTYSPVPAKSLDINQIPTHPPPPDAANWYRGEVGERPPAKLAFSGPGRCSSVTPTAPGRSPSILPWQEGQSRPAGLAGTPAVRRGRRDPAPALRDRHWQRDCSR